MTEAREWTEDGAAHIDVRGLPPPQPLVAILRRVHTLGPGEELVSPCGCLDDFPEAVVMMQTVRLGGADLVCTGTAR